jgi:putative transposase
VAVNLGRSGNSEKKGAGTTLTISETTLYNWKARYGGMQVSDAKRLKSLEEENRRLKRLLAEAHLDLAALKDIAAGKF